MESGRGKNKKIIFACTGYSPFGDDPGLIKGYISYFPEQSMKKYAFVAILLNIWIVSWKCDFVTNQRRFSANFPTLLNRNLHPDCNNWTNIYPQCVKGNSCSRRWHLGKSSPVQIGQRKVRAKSSKSESHLEILLSRHISTEIQTKSYFPCDQFLTSSQRIEKPLKGVP